jgi:glycosyltransferase involved in cell wall biosynthesis
LVESVDDMPAAFLLADLALQVSIEPEGFGRVAVEAQAMRCPVIVARIGALPETLMAAPDMPESEITGWAVEPGDAAALADAIAYGLRLARDERQAIGRRGRAHVLRRFSLAQMQRDTLLVYDRLLATDLAGRFERSARLDTASARPA